MLPRVGLVKRTWEENLSSKTETTLSEIPEIGMPLDEVPTPAHALWKACASLGIAAAIRCELVGIRDGIVEHVWPVLARGCRT